jgi:hypothetical protein
MHSSACVGLKILFPEKPLSSSCSVVPDVSDHLSLPILSALSISPYILSSSNNFFDENRHDDRRLHRGRIRWGAFFRQNGLSTTDGGKQE